jgi:phytoene dehydrogenase-like protein
MTQPSSAVKVAVIGSGLAGLTAAHLLANASVDVHLFEKASTLGMDAASISVSTGTEKKDIRIDVSVLTFLVLELIPVISLSLVFFFPGANAIVHVR